MIVEIKVPSAGESVTEAVVATIMKESGSYVQKEEEVLELETDKVNQIIYAPASGILTLNVKVDESVKIDQTIGTIDSSKGSAPLPSPPQVTQPSQEKVTAEPPSHVTPSPSNLPEREVRLFPESYIASLGFKKEPPPAASPKIQKGSKQERQRMSGLRRTIAKRLVEGKNRTAMLTTFNEVDMSTVMEIRHREKETFLKKHGVKLGLISFFFKACISALKEVPVIQAFIDGDEIVYNHSYHIGISVSTDRGLMVPVIQNGDHLSFAEIERKIQEYAEKAREGGISIEDLKGGNFTITNGGVFGSLFSTPILNPPQSAILGMHNIVKRAVVVSDEIVIRPMMYLALSYDHQIIDGKEAVTFLKKVKDLLEKPDRLLLNLDF